MLERKLFALGDARAYTPSSFENDGGVIHGMLAQASIGDWSWRPYRRLIVTGQRCTCTLAQPVGTNCSRHN